MVVNKKKQKAMVGFIRFIIKGLMFLFIVYLVERKQNSEIKIKKVLINCTIRNLEFIQPL